MSTKWRDALKEFSKREIPKRPKKQKVVNISQEVEKARGQADVMVGFNNGRIESKKRQRSKGDRFAFYQVARNGAMTAEQIDFFIKQSIAEYEAIKEKREKQDIIARILA